MKIEDLDVYNLALDLAEDIWKLVQEWDYFTKDTVGKQLVKAVDSISANISEGYSRYFYKENKQFCYYSRGSLSETVTWLQKAVNRELISEVKYNSLFSNLEVIGKKLNNYIKSIGPKPDDK